jgi:hypothetical protein
MSQRHGRALTVTFLAVFNYQKKQQHQYIVEMQ